MRNERVLKDQMAYAKKEGLEEERERIAEKLRKEGVSEDVIARVIETE